ncbi:MAG: thioredoxin-disulfide reductase [Nitrososphaerota archaeon]|nr:thioredoxin-disulfide reductase [Nitrososphaerales archaeon]MDW8045212.1 thioredoxin-disulfide reductase [Nitrososphaerota archaeon]
MSVLKRVIIIGSGPAGLTAAIYVARGGLEPLVISGSTPGGQLVLTTEVENYPGFETGILGPELIERMRRQAERFGAKFVDGDATKVDFSKRPFKVWVGEDVYEGDAVIIATGASAKWLGLESEQRLRGRGVSSCATCDGFFFAGKDVVVVGGGDTALEEALFLTKFVKSVTIVHRRDTLRASKILQDRAFSNEKIKFRWNSEVVEILGKDRVVGVRLKNVKTGELSELKCDGVFIAIGHKPNTELFKGQIELNNEGYVVVKEGTYGTSTSVEGVFVAGDAYDYKYRQAITAAASGCKAAIDAIHYLEAKDP